MRQKGVHASVGHNVGEGDAGGARGRRGLSVWRLASPPKIRALQVQTRVAESKNRSLVVDRLEEYFSAEEDENIEEEESQVAVKTEPTVDVEQEDTTAHQKQDALAPGLNIHNTVQTVRLDEGFEAPPSLQEVQDEPLEAVTEKAPAELDVQETVVGRIPQSSEQLRGDNGGEPSRNDEHRNEKEHEDQEEHAEHGEYDEQAEPPEHEQHEQHEQRGGHEENEDHGKGHDDSEKAAAPSEERPLTRCGNRSYSEWTGTWGMFCHLERIHMNCPLLTAIDGKPCKVPGVGVLFPEGYQPRVSEPEPRICPIRDCQTIFAEAFGLGRHFSVGIFSLSPSLG